MSHRKKILIIERDDFLREIIGNLLHKKGLYVLNGFSIQNGLEHVEGHDVDTVILGTSCHDYKGKQSLDYIKKNISVGSFFILNNESGILDFIPEDKQMNISALSIEKLIKNFV